MKLITKVGILTIVLLTTACAQFKIVKSTQTNVKGFTVTPATEWSKSPFEVGPNAEAWTMDGFNLNTMYVFGELSNGQTIFNNVDESLPMPKFRPDMLPNELEDLVKTSIVNLNYGGLTIQSKNVRPEPLGDQIAFRFEIEFFDPDGLKKSGDIMIWVKEEKLYGMMFIAPTMHYYNVYKANLEQTFNSIKA